MADAPQWILDRIIKIATMPTVTAAPAPVEFDIYKINPDAPRDIWFRVVAALHHATGGSEAGYSTAEQWNRSGTKEYDDAATAVRTA